MREPRDKLRYILNHVLDQSSTFCIDAQVNISLIMSEWYAGGIEHSPYPPPMLESEKTVEKRVTDYGNMCALSGFIFSSLYMYNRCGAVKARFASMGLKV